MWNIAKIKQAIGMQTKSQDEIEYMQSNKIVYEIMNYRINNRVDVNSGIGKELNELVRDYNSKINLCLDKTRAFMEENLESPIKPKQKAIDDGICKVIKQDDLNLWTVDGLAQLVSDYQDGRI